MRDDDDTNAARGIALGTALGAVAWLLIFLALCSGCSLIPAQTVECVRYEMRGDCERPFFETR
jgi:hypothetical protein